MQRANHFLTLTSLALFAILSSVSSLAHGYSTSAPTTAKTAPFIRMMPGVATPTREKTDRKTKKKNKTNNDNDSNNKKKRWQDAFVWKRDGPLEYLQDDVSESREDNDPFHILLLGATFDDVSKPKITVPYVATSLEYVLEVPPDEAMELTTFAFEHGLSCLGTWPREECLTLAKQIQVRDIACRVVPYAQGGQRGWQAKDASMSSAGSSSAGSDGFGSAGFE